MTGKNSRPTSPHLQIYKLPPTAVISITHRITGVFLTLGLLAVGYLLWVLSQGQSEYDSAQQILNTWFGQLVFWGFVFALLFHFCHGIRHLVWDVGNSFSAETLNKYAVVELMSALLLTVIAWGLM
jgi:succinate dehydrogenase / fumarate reductase, cytochrome b subunit